MMLFKVLSYLSMHKSNHKQLILQKSSWRVPLQCNHMENDNRVTLDLIQHLLSEIFPKLILQAASRLPAKRRIFLFKILLINAACMIAKINCEFH